MVNRHAWRAPVLAFALGGFVAGTLSGTPPAMARDGRKAAAIITGLALGAAAIAAASRSHRSEYYQPYDGPGDAGGPVVIEDDPAPDEGYGNAGAFQPYEGVTCYPAQRSCYKANGRYSPTISARIFGN